jgi:hypothetical protein
MSRVGCLNGITSKFKKVGSVWIFHEDDVFEGEDGRS